MDADQDEEEEEEYPYWRRKDHTKWRTHPSYTPGRCARCLHTRGEHDNHAGICTTCLHTPVRTPPSGPEEDENSCGGYLVAYLCGLCGGRIQRSGRGAPELFEHMGSSDGHQATPVPVRKRKSDDGQ